MVSRVIVGHIISGEDLLEMATKNGFEVDDQVNTPRGMLNTLFDICDKFCIGDKRFDWGISNSDPYGVDEYIWCVTYAKENHQKYGWTSPSAISSTKMIELLTEHPEVEVISLPGFEW
jgi:hypothetical protein